MGGDAFLTGMPFTKRNHATGSTGSRNVPWVQPRHWFHSFQTGSLGSNTQWFHRFHRFHTGSLGSTRHSFHRFHTGSLGLTTLWVQQVPYRCLGFSHATGSTASRQVPWVQGSTQTGSLGSTVELWELWRVWISVNVQTTFCLMHRCAAPGMRFWQECLSRKETTPLVPQVPERFLGFNHATGSTASRQAPWVQTRNGSTGSTGSTQVLWVQHATGSTGSTGSPQVPWV